VLDDLLLGPLRIAQDFEPFSSVVARTGKLLDYGYIKNAVHLLEVLMDEAKVR
jgi:hypothetical protein